MNMSRITLTLGYIPVDWKESSDKSNIIMVGDTDHSKTTEFEYEIQNNGFLDVKAGNFFLARCVIFIRKLVKLVKLFLITWAGCQLQLSKTSMSYALKKLTMLIATLHFNKMEYQILKTIGKNITDVSILDTYWKKMGKLKKSSCLL